MNGFGKALIGMIHVSMNRLMARKISAGVTMLALAGIVMLMTAGGASAGEQGGIGCVNSTGWAYQCGDTVTESCTFNGDMSCESGHGLVISADGITIDGAGHAIIGNRTDCPRCWWAMPQRTYCGILNDWIPPNGGDSDNVVIKNLEVKNFCIGIAIRGAHNNTIFNCSVHHNGDANVTYTYGITVLYSDHITIDDCNVYNNTGIILDSVTTAGHGIHFYDNCDHCNVTDSFIANNYLSGIWASAYGCSNLYIANNTVVNNGICGDNLMGGTSGINLHWEGCVPSPINSVVENNRVLNNTGAGIYAAQNTITIKDNVVTGTKNGTGYVKGHGLSIRSSGGHGKNINIYNNTFCDNEGWDIYDDISGGSNTGDNNTCDTTYNYNDTGTTGCTYKCVHHIVIRDVANGEGSEVTTHTMTTAENFHAWCAGYDADSNYINDVPCTWNTTGMLDPIPAGHSTSAIFSPSTSDTNGTITAVCGQGYTDNTGTITVEAEGGCVGLITGHVYHCGEVVTESCTLSGNMRCTNNTKPGLYIGADNVVIDGDGFCMTGVKDAAACRLAVSGPTPCESNPAKHSGILNGYDGTLPHSYDNVVIKNLEIENFCTGIAVGSGVAGYIDNMTVTGCFIHDCGEPTMITHGIHMVYTNNCNIIKNDISNIQGTGGSSCSGGGNGIFMYGSGSRGKHNTITRNNLSYNAKSGFFMKMQCMYNTISSNTATEYGK
jgi:parallel beta-helix repeat protein